jgi:hypothetical protein
MSCSNFDSHRISYALSRTWLIQMSFEPKSKQRPRRRPTRMTSRDEKDELLKLDAEGRLARGGFDSLLEGSNPTANCHIPKLILELSTHRSENAPIFEHRLRPRHLKGLPPEGDSTCAVRVPKRPPFSFRTLFRYLAFPGAAQPGPPNSCREQSWI